MTGFLSPPTQGSVRSYVNTQPWPRRRTVGSFDATDLHENFIPGDEIGGRTLAVWSRSEVVSCSPGRVRHLTAAMLAAPNAITSKMCTERFTHCCQTLRARAMFPA